MTSYLALMVKKLNSVENIIDNFEDVTANINDYLYEKYQEENPNYEPRVLEEVEIIGSILMSLMLPGLIVATFFLIIKFLDSLGKHIITKRKKVFQIISPNSYKKINKMTNLNLDPERITLPRKQNTGMFIVRIFLTILLIVAVFFIFLSHCYIWNKSGANIDSINNFGTDSPISLRELHEKMGDTLDMVTSHLETMQKYMPNALAELSHLTSVDVQEIIEDKIDRVTGKAGEFSDFAANLNSFKIDSDNKTWSTFLSFCFVSSSVVAMWFWFLIISYKFEDRLGWFCATVFWCSTFLTFVLMNIYTTMFIPYLCSSIQPESKFILQIIGVETSYP